MVSKPRRTVRCWRRVVTRSRCSPVVWTALTRAGTVTCWIGWVMWVRWSVSFLPERCRRGTDFWLAPDCWGQCRQRRWSWRPARGAGGIGLAQFRGQGAERVGVDDGLRVVGGDALGAVGDDGLAEVPHTHPPVIVRICAVTASQAAFVGNALSRRRTPANCNSG